jgi:hypothetical protein
MNAQIRRLFFVLVVLFVSVIGMITWWLWKAPDLEARRGNPNLLVKQLTIERGRIYAADGRTVLARNHAVKKKNIGPTRSATRRSSAPAPASRSLSTTT